MTEVSVSVNGQNLLKKGVGPPIFRGKKLHCQVFVGEWWSFTFKCKKNSISTVIFPDPPDSYGKVGNEVIFKSCESEFF